MKFFLISVFLFGIFALNISAQTATEKGIESFKKGDYKDAVSILKVVTKKNPKDFDAWFYLGSSFFRQDNLKEAKKALEKAADLQPDNPKPLIGLAFADLVNNKLNEAEGRVNKALKLNSQEFEAVYIQGLIRFRKASFDSAYKSAVKAIELNPKFAPAYLLKTESLISRFGQLYVIVSKPENQKAEFLKEAIGDLEKYIQLSTDKKDVAYQSERLESLKYFADYYSKPENNIEIKSDTPVLTENTTPLKILSKSRPSYTEQARQAGISGEVKLLVVFSAQGKIQDVMIVKGLSHGLSREAIIAARKIIFEPATKDGKPIPQIKMVAYTFNLL